MRLPRRFAPRNDGWMSSRHVFLGASVPGGTKGILSMVEGLPPEELTHYLQLSKSSVILSEAKDLAFSQAYDAN
jgi:hypothetical protein